MEGDLTMTANWHPDPTGEHELRYWDGRMWTEHVADQGVQSVSPLPTVAPASTTTQTDLAAAHAEQERATQDAVSEEEQEDPAVADEVMVDAAAEPEAETGDESAAPDDDVAMIHQPVVAAEPAEPDVEEDHDEAPANDTTAVAHEVDDAETAQDVPTDDVEPSSSFGPEPSFSTIGGADAYDDGPIRNPLTAGPVEDAPGADPLPDEDDDLVVDELAPDQPAAADGEPAADTDELVSGSDEQVVADQPEPAVEEIVPEESAAPAEAEAEIESQDESLPAEADGQSQVAHDEPAAVDVAPEVAATVVPSVVDAPPQETPEAAPSESAEAAPVTEQAEAPVTAGISGELIDGRFSEVDGAGAALQNSRLLRVRVGEAFMARQGSMVAYQGDVAFAYQGGGASKFLKKAVTGEGLSLMRVEGNGDVFLADTAKHVHVLQLTDSGISVNGANVLAFSSSLEWNVERVKGGSIAAGGLFNTTLRGTGWVAVTTDGEPVVLNAGEAPTFADTNAVVAWSADLQTSLKTSMSAGALIGRGSGEAIQVAFAGQGFVIVQPSEGYPTPAS